MVESGMMTAKDDGSGSSKVASSPRAKTIFILSCLALALIKLWLVHSDEVACLGSPFDDIGYAQSAKDWYWLRSYRDLTLGTPPYIRPPVFPLYVAIASLTGIPLRLTNELLYVAAAFVFAWVLIKAGRSQLLCALIYSLIIFHPGSFVINNLVYPDAIYTPFLLFSLAGMIFLFLRREDRRRLWYAVVAGLLLGILWHVRQESIAVVGFLTVYALLLLLVGRREAIFNAHTFKLLGVLVVVPALMILTVSLIVKTVNYAKIGVFAADAMFTSDFEKASKALLRVKPAVPIRYVPVPRETRARVYRVSPAFKELERYFEGDSGQTWAKFGKDVGVKAPGEISAGHFWWALNQATYLAGYNKSARQAGQFYRRLAREINAACGDGRLECRPVFSSLIDPHPQNYLPHMPHSFKLIAALFNTSIEMSKPVDIDNLPPEVRELFDSVATRRAALRHQGAARVSGWAYTLKDELQGVMLRTRDGQILAASSLLTARPDVVSAYKDTSTVAPLNTGFDLQIASPSTKIERADLVFTTAQGKELTVSRPGLKNNVPGEELIFNIETDVVRVRTRGWEDSVQSFIWAVHGKFITLLTYVGLLALLTILIFYRSVNFKQPAFMIIALVAAVIAIRVFIFTLVDASAYTAHDIRYIFPVLGLYTSLLLLLISYSFNHVAARMNLQEAWQKAKVRTWFGRRTKQSTQAEENVAGRSGIR